MKGRQSGMPDEEYWATFFDPDAAVAALMGPGPVPGDIVEFGCGYGTFTVAAARHTTGTVTALDIDSGMVDATRQRAAIAGATNVQVFQRDFVANGTGLPVGSQMHAMIYNLLHIEEPLTLLQEAFAILQPGGRISVMHWRSDMPTPRGPSLDIRPTPQQCADWMTEAGFRDVVEVPLGAGNPFHFGLVGVRR